MSNKKFWVCEKCNDPKVQIKAWVDANTNKVIERLPMRDDSAWCDNCGEHVYIVEKTFDGIDLPF